MWILWLKGLKVTPKNRDIAPLKTPTVSPIGPGDPFSPGGPCTPCHKQSKGTHVITVTLNCDEGIVQFHLT